MDLRHFLGFGQQLIIIRQHYIVLIYQIVGAPQKPILRLYEIILSGRRLLNYLIGAVVPASAAMFLDVPVYTSRTTA